jgi:hypothetical protein
MIPLSDLQAAFAAGVLRGDRAVLATIDGRGLDPGQRLAIHRNTTFLTLTEALGDTFPVVRRLVGEAFFGQLARDFIRAHPPASGCLLDLGLGFPAHVEDYPPARRLPYLADVAALEWAWHGALHDAEGPVLDPASLAGLPPALVSLTRFMPIAASRLLCSPWPVEAIWRANQPDVVDPDPIDLGEGSCRLLVLRPGVEVLFMALSEGEAVLWRELALGAPLGEAAALAEASDVAFDLGAALARLFAAGAFARAETP